MNETVKTQNQNSSADDFRLRHYNTELQMMEKRHGSEINSVQARHQTELKSIKARHESEMKRLNSRFSFTIGTNGKLN
jgi:hypothetical protein